MTLILAMILMIVTNAVAAENRVSPTRLDGMSKYGLYDDSQDSREINRIWTAVRIKEGTDSVVDTIGSFLGGYFVAVDTNVILNAVCNDNDCYLETLTLSDTIRVDTLFRQRLTTRSWLEWPMFMQGSIRESVVSYSSKGYPDRCDLTVLRVKSVDSLDTLLYWSRMEGWADISHDFSQILFVNGDSDIGPDCPVGLAMIYDIATDSLIRISRMTGVNRSLARRSYEEPIIYRKLLNGRFDLWAFDQLRGEFQLTSLTAGQSVKTFEIKPDSITVWMEDSLSRFGGLSGFSVPNSMLTDVNSIPISPIRIDSLFDALNKRTGRQH